MILLGLGFTAIRVAKHLLARGEEVHGIAREPERFAGLRAVGLQVMGFEAVEPLRRGTLIHSIPPLEGADREWLRAFVRSLKPSRVIYISATSVYGDQVEVNETTVPRPSGEKSRSRYDEEEWLRQGDWSTLAIRPAAIYGPGRGVHQKIREGAPSRGAGTAVVSRIHVEDLAAVVDAATRSDLEGGWPLADDCPCSSDEIAAFCARLMRVTSPGAPPTTFPVAGRRVDGRRIRQLLGIDLLYPTYESGILASCSHSLQAL